MIATFPAPWIDSWLVLALLFGLGMVYCALHRWAEGARRAILARREEWPLEKVVGELPAWQEVDVRIVAEVLSAVAAELGIRPGQVRVGDRMDHEYQPRYAWLLLDETDELIRDSIRKNLARIGLPGWRARRWKNSIGALILQVHEFAAEHAHQPRHA